MATVTATAVIRAIDQASPVFRAVGASAKGVAGVYGGIGAAASAAAARTAGVAAAVDNTGRRVMSTFALPAMLGFGALIQRTQEFEKALYGVQVAGIADNLENGAVNFERIRRDAEMVRDAAMAFSKAMNLSPEGFMKAGEAAGKIGLGAQQLREVMRLSGFVRQQDRDISQERAAEFIGSRMKIYKLDGADKDYEKEAQVLTNQWLGVANMTMTSASRVAGGLKMFESLFAHFGNNFAQNASLIGAMVQAGYDDSESGVALRSAGARVIVPTAGGRDAMLAMREAGIKREKYMNLSALSSKEAFNNLIKMTDVTLSKQDRALLRKMLNEGAEQKKFLDPNWHQELLREYNRMTGADVAGQEARDRNADRLGMATMAGGGKVDMFRYLQDIAAGIASGKITDVQLAHLFEKRQLARMQGLFRMMNEVNRVYDKIKDINTEFTEAGNLLWKTSDAGRWEGAIAALDRALVRLRGSEGVRSLVGGFEKLSNFIADLPKGVVDFGGKAMLASVGVAALGAALAGISRVAASPAMRLLAGGAGLAYLLGGSELLQGFDRLDARDPAMPQFLAPNAPIFGTIDEFKKLIEEAGNTIAMFAPAANEASGAIKALFGMDPSDSLLLGGLKSINEALRTMTSFLQEWQKLGFLGAVGKAATPDVGKFDPSKPTTWLHGAPATLKALEAAVQGSVLGRDYLSTEKFGPPTPPGLVPPAPGSTLEDRRAALGGIMGRAKQGAPVAQPSLRELAARVTGQANVTVGGSLTVQPIKVDVDVKVEGGQKTGQRQSGGEGSVKLNTGQSMMDLDGAGTAR
jgi:hypothetical protein